MGPIPCSCTNSTSFRGILRHLSGLHSLNLGGSYNLSSWGLHEIVNSCPYLEELNIDSEDGPVDFQINHMIENYRGRLRNLWLRGAWLTDESFANLDQLADTLQLLSIFSEEKLGEQGLRAIANLTNLETLILDAIEETPDSAFVSAFSDCAGQLSRLRILDLRWCLLILDASLVAMAQASPNQSTLKLTYCPKLTDAGLSSLFNICKSLVSLELNAMKR